MVSKLQSKNSFFKDLMAILLASGFKVTVNNLFLISLSTQVYFVGSLLVCKSVYQPTDMKVMTCSRILLEIQNSNHSGDLGHKLNRLCLRMYINETSLFYPVKIS